MVVEGTDPITFSNSGTALRCKPLGPIGPWGFTILAPERGFPTETGLTGGVVRWIRNIAAAIEYVGEGGDGLNRREFLGFGAAAVAALAATKDAGAQADLDIVIRGGRVIDPESGLDAVRNVGIAGGKIAAVSDAELQGRTMLDASGLVVAPGFIDILAHGMDRLNNRVQAQDGVTTVLALEGETADVDKWYADHAG